MPNTVGNVKPTAVLQKARVTPGQLSHWGAKRIQGQGQGTQSLRMVGLKPFQSRAINVASSHFEKYV